MAKQRPQTEPMPSPAETLAETPEVQALALAAEDSPPVAYVHAAVQPLAQLVFLRLLESPGHQAKTPQWVAERAFELAERFCEVANRRANGQPALPMVPPDTIPDALGHKAG